MWLAQAMRNRNLFFFSRVNPDIFTGGFFSEEKWSIYELFPAQRIPLSYLVDSTDLPDDILEGINTVGIVFPLLVKPNIGERGMGIRIIETFTELRDYHLAAAYDYIIQQLVPFGKEMSVLAYYLPGSNDVKVTSICIKEKLTIIGDGISTIEELVLCQYRSRKNWSRLKDQFEANHILKRGESLILEPIGNHSRGTIFLDGNHLISDSFTKTIKQLFNEIDGEVFYGRFDIMFSNFEEFEQLKDFKIVEFNGVGSEPAHIYQPGYSLIKAYKELWQHAKILGNISILQGKRGRKCMTWHDFKSALKTYRRNLKLVMK